MGNSFFSPIKFLIFGKKNFKLLGFSLKNIINVHQLKINYQNC